MRIENVYAKIREQKEKQLPFVIYRKPDATQLEVLLQNNNTLYEIEDYSSSGFVFAPFDTSKKAILSPFAHSNRFRVSIPNKNIEKNEEFLAEISGLSDTTNNQVNHIRLVEKGIKAIALNDLRKVVLSRQEKISGFTSLDSLHMFRKLIDNYSKAFVYYWYHPKVGTWLGATPETLLEIKDDQFSTMALAGTQPYKIDNPIEWESKELEEQEMVTKFILDELSQIANDIVSSKTYTHRAGTLLHLRTDIKARLVAGKSRIENIINILHPTPAVCGLPKEKARSFILQHEGYDRKFYTGFLGELNLETQEQVASNLFVNLRCMEIVRDKAILYVGGGITKDSVPEKEWRETVNKTETMKKVLF
ncbi:chorismate-binding protein [Aquimarina gracilis]|uniref:isochorismate synthase n=1 Tax=Aquimarina gracilis TaxID=874422 RepID=A0ABU5ZXR3_9FLAO|nr:chorismate-binding protein [Aquimarina gracilis]MEB3346662.1 chorismate-binding protein [Aquimarina gracilis]